MVRPDRHDPPEAAYGQALGLLGAAAHPPAPPARELRFYVEGYGCSQNLGEAEEMARAATRAGHRRVADPSEADVGLLVTCGVIGATEARMVRRWRELVRRVPRVVVSGCLVPFRGELLEGPGRERTEMLPIREQHRLPELLAEISGPASTRSGEPAPPEPPVAPLAEEVTLAQGCTSRCSYCFSRLARGPLSSVPLAELLERVRLGVERGTREIRLSSLDSSCWGSEWPAGPRLPELLERVQELPGSFAVRVGMMSPQSLRPIAERYFRVMARGRLFRFLHLPVQSGSDRVLAEMRRGYTVSEFEECVRRARELVPEVVLSTDLIVGYPTESEEEFDRSLELLERLTPEVVNVTRFSPRPMTPAARLRPITPRIVKRRSRRLAEARMRVGRARLESWIGRREPALLLERGPRGSSLARLANYLPVVLEASPPLGEWREVVIDGSRSNYLLGRLVDGCPAVPPL